MMTIIHVDKIGEPSSTYDVVISIGASAAGHQTDFLFELARVLKPSGSLVLREPLLLGSKVRPTRPPSLPLQPLIGMCPTIVLLL